MVEPVSSVYVEPVAGRANVLRMVWSATPNADDVRTTFRQLTNTLEAADGPIHIIVDLLANPSFPMGTTIMETVNGPARHKNMGDWLVVGANRMARTIGGVVNAMSKRKNIYWFDSEEAALAALDEGSN